MKTWKVPMEFTYRGHVIVKAESAREATDAAEAQHWESDDLATLEDWGTLGVPKEV